MENESVRKETIAAILERNPVAFRPKISNITPAPQAPAPSLV
jgi:hypothetical protein